MARPMISRNANPFLPTIHSAVLQKDSPLYRAMRMACLLRCICSIKEANKAIRLIYTTFLKASMDGLSADANSEAAIQIMLIYTDSTTSSPCIMLLI